jgi:hypothetical protein
MNNARKSALNPDAAAGGADVAVGVNARSAVTAELAWSAWNPPSENALNRQNTQFVQNAPSAGTKPEPKRRHLRRNWCLRRSMQCQKAGLPPLRLHWPRPRFTP